MSLRSRLLWMLDRVFPPEPSAFMRPEQCTEHETVKASSSMGRYLERHR